MINLPDTPKVCSLPSISRAYTMPVKQRGHQVTAMALPPHSVVDYLVARHQIDMIGPVLAIDGHTDHSLCRVHLALGPSAGEHRVQDRRDAVAAEDGDHFEVDRAV